ALTARAACPSEPMRPAALSPGLPRHTKRTSAATHSTAARRQYIGKGSMEVGIARASGRVDPDLLYHLCPGIIEPAQFQIARPGHPHVESHVRIGRDTRLHFDLEHLLATERGGEGVDDVARDRLAFPILALTGFQELRDERL